MYRPSPLVRAYCLEKYLDTPAEIYYKFEGNNTSGSHKLNSAIAQAYYAKQQGLKGVTTETGAGQWGTALSMACGYFGLDLTVYMVRCSYEQKPQRRTLMNVYGANVIPSPSDTTAVGRKMLAEHPDNTSGSLGTAISEAVEVALTKPDTRYVLGSVLNQVVLHQSVIGLESKTAMEKFDVYPDMVIGCAGGGSNLGGLMSPFMRDKLKGERDPYFIAVEPMSCPSLTRGKFAYDFCDTGKVTPLAKMYTLGSGFMPAPSHAGGLRYHGMSPILSQLYHDGYINEARAVSQVDVFRAAIEFARVEGILPAPESAHAIKVTLDEARKCKETGEKKVILFGLTGTGYFDMISYDRLYERGAERRASHRRSAGRRRKRYARSLKRREQHPHFDPALKKGGVFLCLTFSATSRNVRTKNGEKACRSLKQAYPLRTRRISRVLQDFYMKEEKFAQKIRFHCLVGSRLLSTL